MYYSTMACSECYASNAYNPYNPYNAYNASTMLRHTMEFYIT